MTLAYWESLRTLDRLSQSMQGLIAALLESCHQSTLWVGNAQTNCIGSIELWETNTDVILHAHIQDMEAEQLDVQVTQETALIQGKLMRHEVEDYLYPNHFQSIIPLPSLVRPETVRANLQENTLTLRLTKLHAVPAQRVRVNLIDRKTCDFTTPEHRAKHFDNRVEVMENQCFLSDFILGNEYLSAYSTQLSQS
ncbi:MAG TPA: Hsp20/alpha crystallin family protein [Coleofasciculaceae cyanobacterium]